MSKFISWSITCIALLAMGLMYWTRDAGFAEGEHRFRPVQPMTSRTAELPGRERVPLSETRALDVDQLVEISEYPVGEINIQKLTDNSYWILHNLHAMTMYVGEKEVLLVDAPEDLFVDRLFERIAAITPNPVTTFVYTHPHLDHIKGANVLVDAIRARGHEPRIIGSDRLVQAMDRYQQVVPRPTEIVPAPGGYFEFDGRRFKLATPVDVAHSTADSYVLFPDGVITFIDFVYANRLPLHDYSGVQNMTGYIEFLRHVAGEEWKLANTGHSNVSSPQDVERFLEYTKDLYDAWFEVIPQNWGVPQYLRGKVKGDFIAVWLRNTFDKVAYEMAAKLEPKWGHYPQFELALDHALKVQWDGFLHYDFFDHPEIRPQFTPIPPEGPHMTGATSGDPVGSSLPQRIPPVPLLVPRTDGDVYDPPSAEQPLTPGHRVDVGDFGEPGKWYVQRLTERTWWMMANAFASTVFVGDEGVLVVDASSSVNPADMLAAIGRFTDLPVTTLVYSHPHTDHNAGAVRLQQALEAQGHELRIVSSASAAREIAAHQNNVAPPTEVVPDGRSTFRFERWDFVLGTPEVSAHSTADSYVLTPDGVIMYVDFNYPGRVPLGYISSSHNITGWVDFLRHVLAEDWQFANLGHANIGYKRDIEQTFAYLGDLYDAYVSEVLPAWERGEAFRRFAGPTHTAGVFWSNFVDDSAQKMADKVYPKWRHVAQSEVVRSHAYKVFEDAFLNYNPSIGVSRPDFSPLGGE